MADPIHSIKQGSIKPDLVATLKDSAGQPVDLTDADSVALEVATLGGDVISVTGTFLNRPGGQVKLPMNSSISGIPGTHKASIVVSWGGAEGTEGFPNPGDLWIRVHRNSRADV